MNASSPRHDVFQAVADPTRREIIRLLADQALSIAAIAGRFPITRTAINKHLQILSDAGLLHRQRVGRETRYRLQPDPLRELQQWVAEYERYWDEKLAALQKYVETGSDE